MEICTHLQFYEDQTILRRQRTSIQNLKSKVHPLRFENVYFIQHCNVVISFKVKFKIGETIIQHSKPIAVIFIFEKIGNY